MATVERENIGLLNDKIIVKVSKEDYFPTFEKKLKEYSKTVNMPGFRKGMVPTGMIKKMYGPSIYTDEVLKTVEQQLYTYLDKEKPEIFAQPLALDADIRKLDLNNPADYEFGFEIGLKPEFEIAPLSKASLTFNKVKATDAMVNEEVERMQEKGGSLKDVDVVDNDENVITLSFTEVGTDVSKEISVALKDFSAATQAELKGKEKDATITVQLSNAFEGAKLDAVVKELGLTEAGDKSFTLKIVKIGLLEKRNLDETFFGEVFPGAAIATEDEFRNKLKEEIQQYWDAQSRNQLHDQLYHYLVDETKMEFPAEFLKRWLQTGSQEKKTAEQAEEEFPVFSNQLKWTLISDKLTKDNNLDVTADELKASMKAEVSRYFGSMNIGEDTSWLDSYVERMMKDEKQVEGSYRRLLTDKLFSWAETQATPTEKEVSPEELNGLQHHHHH